MYAKAAAVGSAPGEVSEGYRKETSLSHMTRVATEARSRETAEWITGRVRAERRHRSPSGRGLHRPQLRRVRKTLAGRYYQLLAGSCGDRVPLAADKKDGHERVLVVRQRRAPVAASLHPVPGVGTAG